MQACATGVRTLLAAAQEIEVGLASTALVLNCDRTSNGPHLYYPNPRGPGGTGAAEDWVMDNFGCDPLGGHSMLATAENVAKRHGFTTAEQHEVVLRREEQYRASLADGAAFLKRFMTLPFEVPAPGFKKTAGTLEADEGISQSTAEGLAKLKPVLDGRHRHLRRPDPSGRRQRGDRRHHAASGRASSPTNPKIAVRLHGFGQARAELAYMPEATVPAAQRALAQAGKRIDQIAAIKTHNPFAINDLLFARANERRLAHHEQLRLLAGLGPSAGADGNALDHRTDRGTGAARRRLRPVHRLRGRRHRDVGGARSDRRLTTRPAWTCRNGSRSTRAARRPARRCASKAEDISYAALAAPDRRASPPRWRRAASGPATASPGWA